MRSVQRGLVSTVMFVALCVVWCGGMVMRADSGLATLPASPQSTPFSLPAGEGREAVMRFCLDCHVAQLVVAKRRSLAGWEQMIAKMRDNGAEGTDDDLQKVITYLSRAYGTVNVNTADSRELEGVLELTPALAEAVIKGRPYAAAADLAKVPGINAKAIETMKDRIAYQ